MTARNLDEAIQRAMTMGKASEFKSNMKNEIRDLMAHAVMTILGEKITESETELLYKFYKKVIG